MIVFGVKYKWRAGAIERHLVFHENEEQTGQWEAYGRTGNFRYEQCVYHETDVYQTKVEIPCLYVHFGNKEYFFVFREGVWYQSVDINPHSTVMNMMEPNTLTLVD
jgi:hypothetical protein